MVLTYYKKGFIMSIAKSIFSAVKKRYESGMTQQTIADEAGISREYVRDILNKKCPAEKITIDYLQKLFPRATVDLEGRSCMAGDLVPQNAMERKWLEMFRDLSDDDQADMLVTCAELCAAKRSSTRKSEGSIAG